MYSFNFLCKDNFIFIISHLPQPINLFGNGEPQFYGLGINCAVAFLQIKVDQIHEHKGFHSKGVFSILKEECERMIC